MLQKLTIFLKFNFFVDSQFFPEKKLLVYTSIVALSVKRLQLTEMRRVSWQKM